MGFRIAGAALRGWRDRIEGRLGIATDQSEVRAIFTLWLVAFLLKHSGSAWDVAWHFRYVFGAASKTEIEFVSFGACTEATPSVMK